MRLYKTRRINRGISGSIVAVTFLVLTGIVMVIPFIFAINSAFKPIEELYRFPPRMFVLNPTFNNFRNFFNLLGETNMSFFRYVFNTVLLTVVGTFGQIVLSSLCAYSLSKIPFPGANIVFKIIVTSLMISTPVTAVQQYIIFAKLDLIDTYIGMFIPYLTTTMGLYLMKQFMENTIPNELLEAARIDGAGELSIFFRVVMPLLKPAWMTLAILSIQTLWNAPSSNTYSEEFKTLSQALTNIISGGIQQTGVSGAISIIMMFVPIIFFIIAQSNIIDTMSTSGMKG